MGSTKRKHPSDRRHSKNSARKRLMARTNTDQGLTCSTPGCGRPVSAVGGKGFSMTLCRACIQRLARNGSTWSKRVGAGELRPFIRAAEKFIAAHLDDTDMRAAISGVGYLLGFAPRLIPAEYLRWESPESKARQVLSRLDLKGINPARLLSVYLGVSALLYGHPHYPQTERFRLINVAKVLFRMAGGTARTQTTWDPETGTTGMKTTLTFPRSSGLVLVKLGDMVELEASRALRFRDEVAAVARVGAGT